MRRRPSTLRRPPLRLGDAEVRAADHRSRGSLPTGWTPAGLPLALLMLRGCPCHASSTLPSGWLMAPRNHDCRAYGALAWRQATYGLEYDESYLLGVVDSIASGTGFVDDGVSYFTAGTPFHPLISTGPVLLLPAALVWKVTGGDLT